MDVRHGTLEHRGLAVATLRAAPPGDGPFPGVLLAHDAWGLDAEIEALAGALAADGLTVLAPDLLGGRRAVDADEAHAIAAGLDPEDAALLLAAAADALTADPATQPRRIGAVGLGMGAPLAAFLATIRPEIAVVVLAGPVPELPIEAWTRAEASIVVLETADAPDEADAPDDEADSVDPAGALDRARAAGRRVEVVAAPRDAELAPLILEVLGALRGAS